MIIGGFIIFIFIIYRLFKLIMRGALVAGIGFSFPYLVNYLKLPLDIIANTETGIQFATIAVVLYLIYEFMHFIKYFFKLILWPFKVAVGKK